MEKESIGLYISAHPLKALSVAMSTKTDVNLGSVGECKDGERVTVGGMISQVKRLRTKKGDPMVFATLEDLQRLGRARDLRRHARGVRRRRRAGCGRAGQGQGRPQGRVAHVRGGLVGRPLRAVSDEELARAEAGGVEGRGSRGAADPARRRRRAGRPVRGPARGARELPRRLRGRGRARLHRRARGGCGSARTSACSAPPGSTRSSRRCSARRCCRPRRPLPERSPRRLLGALALERLRHEPRLAPAAVPVEQLVACAGPQLPGA